MTTILRSLRDDLRARREAAATRRTLEHELAAYRTPSDISDLLSAAGRSTDPEAELVRSILNDNLAAYHRRVA